MQRIIEDLNYLQDARTQLAAEVPTIFIDQKCDTCGGKWEFDEPNGTTTHCPDCAGGVQYDVEVELPWRYDVCPVCEGRGTHVNPSIDCGGLTTRDFDDSLDPDFRSHYFGGVYDVVCNRCKGRNVVPVVDEDRLTDAERAAWERQERDRAEARAEYLAEVRAGA